MTDKKSIDLLVFLLEEEGADSVHATEILWALIPESANRSTTMLRGTSNADLWIAQNGNPLYQTDSAMMLARRMNQWVRVQLDYNTDCSPEYRAIISYGTDPAEFTGASDSFATAICIAVLKAMA